MGATLITHRRAPRGLRRRLSQRLAKRRRSDTGLAANHAAEVALIGEPRVDIDDDRRRLAWSIVGGPYTHHNGSAQVLSAGKGQARFVWIADLLPNELADPTDQMMQHGIDAVKRTLDSKPGSSGTP
jgi:hypothetical protein